MVEQLHLYWEVLPFFLGFLSLIYFWLWPATLLAFAITASNPFILIAILACLTTVLVKQKNEMPVDLYEPRFYIHMGVLVGMSLTWPEFKSDGSYLFAFALIPFLAYKPMVIWYFKNSGGSLYLSPFLAIGWLKILSEPTLSNNSIVLGSMLIYLMLLMAWYRQIPMTIKFLLLCSAIVASIWVFSANIAIAVVFSGFLVHSIFEKWLWGRSFCLLQLGTWSQAALIVLAMLFSTNSHVSVLHLSFSLALLFMGSQEVCRLCIASAKCREVVLSWWIAKLPLLYLLLILLGISPGVEILLLICFTSLSQEITKSLALKPLKIEDLTDNSCKDDFVKASLN